jgi:hypothetical protein
MRASSFVGQCKLCLQTRNLCDSHLIPKAIYRLLRSTSMKPADPLRITVDSTFQTSEQISDYVFCVECEKRLRAGGEDWTLANCFRGGPRSTFRLRDLTLASKLLDDGVPAKIYSAESNAAIDTEALGYFGVSVIWRAAAHSWKAYGRDLHTVQLGRFHEPIREYLMGNVAFPPFAAMWITVSAYEKPSRAFTVPITERGEQWHRHTFDIPGMRFDLWVGNHLPRDAYRACIVKGRDRPILYSKVPDDAIATHLDILSRTSRVSRKLKAGGGWSWNINQ